jgi:MFS family permease
MKDSTSVTSGQSFFRNVVRLGWVSLLTDISSEMLYAITPLFITQVLGASVGIVGVIEGIAEGTASVLKGISGWQSDRIRKRKAFVFSGYSFSAIAKPLIGIATGWPVVLLARFLDRFGKGVRTSARDALIADSTLPEERGRAYGLHRAMDTAGALVGVAISLCLLLVLKGHETEFHAFRQLYWLAFIPAVAGVLFIFAVKEIPPKRADGAKRKLDLRFGGEFYATLGLYSVFTVGNSSDVFLLLKAENAGLAAEAVIGAYLLYNASYSLLSYPFGKRADRMSKGKLLGYGLLVFALVYIGFALLPSVWLIWPLFLVYGIYMALTDGVSKALIANLVGAEVRGTALGLFYMVTGLLMVASSILAGYLWDHVSSAAPFYLGAAAALVAGLGFLFRKG